MVMHLQEIFIFFQTFYFAISKCEKIAKKGMYTIMCFQQKNTKTLNNDIPTTESI